VASVQAVGLPSLAFLVFLVGKSAISWRHNSDRTGLKKAKQ
jgi:hypothetical protein